MSQRGQLFGPLCAALAATTIASTALSCDSLDAVQSGDWQHPSLKQATCQPYVTMTGQTAASCFWAFALGAPQAKSFADHLWQTVITCRPGHARAPDQRVNHPDSYGLQQWQSAYGIFAVSLKRKGGQGRTLVHLRFEPAAPD